MLSFEITLKNGKIRSGIKALSVSWKSELDVPADSLVISAVYDAEIFEQADRIKAYDGESLIFNGQLDEIMRIRRGSGLILKLCARSAAAVLLDNEAEPLSYRDPTAYLIYEKHLKPFGFTGLKPDSVPVSGDMRIDKGMTHWQVLEMFCKSRYGSKLRISGDGRVYLKGFKSDRQVRFGRGGMSYISIKENKCRHKLLSEIKLKVSATAGYLSSMKNPNPESEYVRRERYVNAVSENSSLYTADNMLERSNLESYYVKLVISGCVTDILGAAAEIVDPVLGKLGGLTVRGISYSLDSGGELTTIALGKENPYVAA